MFRDTEDYWNHRHYLIFNQEQVEEIRRINFEAFEEINTRIIRCMPEFIQVHYTEEIIFDDAEPDFQLFSRVNGPFWNLFPSEDGIQVMIYIFDLCFKLYTKFSLNSTISNLHLIPAKRK